MDGLFWFFDFNTDAASGLASIDGSWRGYYHIQTITGTYSKFTPTSGTIGGSAIGSFVASNGVWSGIISAATPLGSQEVILTDGSTNASAGDIAIRLSLAMGILQQLDLP